MRVTKPTVSVLKVLLADPGQELHGYAIVKATGLGGPTVYKILDRLAREGWLIPRWSEPDPEHPGVPRRRFFKMTEDGVVFAKHMLWAAGR